MGRHTGRTARPEQAERLWKVFHDKNPRRLVQVERDPWPEQWGLAGEGATVYYRSDKWEPDGEYVQYYHDHDPGVQIYQPWQAEKWLDGPCDLPVEYPKTGAILGFCQGWDIRCVDGEEREIEFGDSSVYLCAAPPKGKLLFVFNPRTCQVIAAMAGGRLHVEADGIDG